MYDIITTRGRARLVLLLILAVGLVVDPLSHNHLIGFASPSFSSDGNGSLQHSICPVCAVGGNIAVVQQVAIPFLLSLATGSAASVRLARLFGETLHSASRAPPLSPI